MKTRSNFNIIGVPIFTITSGLVYNEQNQYNAEVAGAWPKVASIANPTVVAIIYANNTLAANTTGGETITLIGFNFLNTSTITVNGVSVSTTFINSNKLTFVTNNMRWDGNYTLTVTNPGSLTGSTTMTFSTPPIFYTSGSLGTFSAGYISIIPEVYSSPVQTVVVTFASGGLPDGVTFNSYTNLISGIAPSLVSSTLYNFSLTVTNSNNQATTQNFSIFIQHQ